MTTKVKIERDVQILETRKAIIKLKKTLTLKEREILEKEIGEYLHKTLKSLDYFIICKSDISEILRISVDTVDYNIEKKNLKAGGHRHKKIIKLQDFLDFFVVDDIIESFKSKKI